MNGRGLNDSSLMVLGPNRDEIKHECSVSITLNNNFDRIFDHPEFTLS